MNNLSSFKVNSGVKTLSVRTLSLGLALTAVLSLGFMLSPSVSAQMADASDLQAIKSRSAISYPAAASPFSLLDLSKLNWSHSYSLSYGSSAYGSGSFGLYTGSVLYEISKSLSMTFALGVGHNPSSLVNSSINADAELYPSFSLDYHPNNSFRLRVDVARSPYALGYRPTNGFSNYTGVGGGSLFASPWYTPYYYGR